MELNLQTRQKWTQFNPPTSCFLNNKFPLPPNTSLVREKYTPFCSSLTLIGFMNNCPHKIVCGVRFSKSPTNPVSMTIQVETLA